MKPYRFLILTVVALCAAVVGWFVGRHRASPKPPPATASTERKVLYYQSAMHPWIKSDQPGRCTICGMELSPIYEGQQAIEPTEGVVILNSNIVQVIGVDTTEVLRRPLLRTLRVAGTIDDNDTRHRFVSAYLDGRVDQLHINYVGAEVMAGQPLATIYSPTLLLAEREYVALAPKPASNLTSTAVSRWEGAAQRLRRLGLTDEQLHALPTKADTNIHSQILAPLSGTVVSRFVYEGQYVKEGDKLFELADFSTMWFVFDAYERDLTWLRLGQRVEVITPAAPSLILTGVVAFIDPNLKEMTRSAKVRVELDNPWTEGDGVPRRLLSHKLFAEAVVHVETPDVLAVPRSAVLATGSKAVAYVDRGGGAYEARSLKLGRVGDELWEVLEGLREHDRVVTSGNLLIDAQAQINAIAQSEAPAPHDHGTSQSSRDMPPSLTTSQRQALHEYFQWLDAVTSSLAADDLKGFNERFGRWPSVWRAVTNAFASDARPTILLSDLAQPASLDAASDLAAARKRFHGLTQPAVALAQRLRRDNREFASLKIYQCPMVDEAVPGVASVGRWLQAAPPLRNPYFGAQMLGCGSEVKP